MYICMYIYIYMYICIYNIYIYIYMRKIVLLRTPPSWRQTKSCLGTGSGRAESSAELSGAELSRGHAGLGRALPSTPICWPPSLGCLCVKTHRCLQWIIVVIREEKTRGSEPFWDQAGPDRGWGRGRGRPEPSRLMAEQGRARPGQAPKP